tara:strand:+ start:2227 stop:2634 length:408 start_codon:yes stop_codon:yes gene_type:complete
MKKINIDLKPEEKILTETAFGTVTNKRVIYFNGMKFGRGGSRKDIPVQHITSVGHEIKQNIFKGIFQVIFGVIFAILIIGIFWFIKGIYNIIGYPILTIDTSGQDKSIMIGKPKFKVDADVFASHLRNAMFNDGK